MYSTHLNVIVILSVLLAFTWISSVEGNSIPNLPEGFDMDTIDDYIYNQALKIAKRNQQAIEKCRFEACMDKFKSVSICSGTSAFYTWAKVLANKMVCK